MTKKPREVQGLSEDAAPTPLHDLRVLEISDRIAGAYCGKLLTDVGADVVKVEPAAGDPFRRFTTTGAAPADGADAPLFTYLNAGKRSVTSLSDELLTGADIVIVTISDFGWTGPWAERPATEFTLQAASGLTGFRGDPAGP
ncbi:CoA transferase, partial [Mycolicibacter minnesotensis]|uniref:CoA transferase n=1 Tax=Mycolicibacter minnesotensis TaxID=1118379 RepID=UPI0021F34441